MHTSSLSSMFSLFLLRALVLAFLALDAISFVHAAIYVVTPAQGSTCHGGQNCTVQWLDDGQSPLLSAIGLCTVGLYTGKQQLLQQLPPVDVSSTHSITFTPNPEAGPDSDLYYIALTSTSFKSNGTTPYIGFSPWFSLDNMSGSFASPLPSQSTAEITLPSAASTATDPPASGQPNPITSTITVGILNTSLPPLPTLSSTPPASSPSSPPSSSGFVTSASTPSATQTPSASAVDTSTRPTPSVNAATGMRVGSSSLPTTLVLTLSACLVLSALS